ncbi:N-methylglutamate dehydrogenase subunit C [Tamaricihabitans halophyticus]|uniref:N-methylglutamate dehydrogenase subunit C n=1 Tax=Tamaricihabitans halophyticus TaxID=1262583 RepID=A0A4R2QAI9_9PSEU|nr:2Fe-2S iron-sulfur cluster-binding protein [Tamaricihabitans halophyticus]TCP43901.1 N-methylglutamate dehydrogenase subunit C [Tamaricihabitans halophyticus]
MTQQPTRTTTRTEGRFRLPVQQGEVLDRGRQFEFFWNGSTVAAYRGDTIISALAAAGERIFSRSYKYHRPRGLLTASAHDPGCMVQVGDEPNVRGAHRLVTEGMRVSAQNAWPSLRFDIKAANGLAGRFLPPGFYYKTFIKPERLWPAYEKVLQRFVHAGEVFPDTPHDYYDKRYAHPDVLIAGGGPAGMTAALAAARAGARVMLVEEEHQLGGHLRWADPPAARQLSAEVTAQDGIEVLTDSVVLGRYDQNWIAVVQRGHPGVAERLIKARARAFVVAAGLLERPYVFAGNDVPGVMLSTAVRRLINLHAVRPGQRAVVLTANDEGDAAIDDLRGAGVEIAHIADARNGGDILRAHGRKDLRAVELPGGRKIEADLLVTATGWTAPTALLNMAGDVPTYSPTAARFLPGGTTDDNVFATGGIAGDGTLDELCTHADAVGRAAARAGLRANRAARAGLPTLAAEPPAPAEDEQVAIPELGVAAHPALFRGATHGMVDYSEDVSSKDIHLAVREGYDSAELAKRYTTATMGPLQGKLETINAIAMVAEATGRGIAETGTTTWRPMYTPVTLGALAGRNFEPVRYSPMQPWHTANAARPLVAGQWIRPDDYGDPAAEVRAVREAVGIIDVTPIGKLDLRGPDIPKLLNLLYVNKWSKLGIGKVRYGVMCAEDGVVFDDGVTGRLGENHYLMSTTSSGAAAVWKWVESWLQTEHPEWQVHVTPVTTGYASINVAGPKSRELVDRLTEGVDLSAEAFGYMQVRTGTIAGVPDCVLWRIGFTGELSYELHVPASYGLHVWEALVQHGADLGVRPFGVEAQRILRLEKGHFIVGQDTDGLTKAYSAALDWAVKLDKDDFVGKPELAWQSESTTGSKLVGLQPVDGAVVPAEASQIITSTGKIGGRITSSRFSPTLGRAICLGQLDASLATPGTEVAVQLPDGQRTTARVTEHLAHVDPEGKRQEITDPAPQPRSGEPGLARSAVTPVGDTGTHAGWLVSTKHSTAALRLSDRGPLTKISVRAAPDGQLANELGTRFGRTTRDAHGTLVVGSGPGEWLVLGAPSAHDTLLTDWQRRAEDGDEFASAVDLTHGRALFRLTGPDAPQLLAKVCGIDFADEFTPDGAALRSSVAKLVTDIIRDDVEQTTSYLLHCERSSGQYLFEALLDAGAEFNIELDGYPVATEH